MELVLDFHYVCKNSGIVSITFASYRLNCLTKLFQVAIDDKDTILASIPADLKDKGSELYATLIDGKVCGN